jgi:hypothetical protein
MAYLTAASIQCGWLSIGVASGHQPACLYVAILIPAAYLNDRLAAGNVDSCGVTHPVMHLSAVFVYGLVAYLWRLRNRLNRYSAIR